jgi:hypothetical protein
MKTELEFDRHGMSDEELARFVGELVETMVTRNRQYLTHYPRLTLMSAGIFYKESSAWRDIPHTLKTGHGDCKSIVPWRLAELREAGEKAIVQVMVLDEARLFHLQVIRGNGTMEDTSRLLGME